MKRKTCEECGGKVIEKKVPFSLYGQELGMFPAEVCNGCGEEVFEENTSEEIDHIAKEKGLWGLEAQTKITKIGASYAVIINKKIAEFAGLEHGMPVHVHPESKGKIVIEA
ncbi:hypothetical protein HYX13_03200 [Candidatus Woesearchaeota archaeon]|nr:hypothetical protein [Candidatus Woesearchaeota archaeon]